MLLALMSQGAGRGLSVWSYEIAGISASAISDDGERFLIGCKNGEYFVFDHFGNMMLTGNFRRPIRAVDIAENRNMVTSAFRTLPWLFSLGHIVF